MTALKNKQKIMKVSGQLAGLARVALLCWGLGMTCFLFATAASIRGNGRAIYLSCGGIIEMVLAIFITLNFLRFFNRLKQGDLFDARTVGYVETAGKWWLGYWLADLVFCLVGNHWLGTTMGVSFGQLLASLVVILVAWLLKEAQGLQEEQALTV